MTTLAVLLHAGKELTAREVDVLQSMADGDSAFETGARIYVSKETIKSHRKTIIGKLEARNGANAVAIGVRRGLIQ